MTVTQYIDRPAPLALPPAIGLLGNEAAGTGLHFAADQHYIRDPLTPANNRLAATADLITAGAMTFTRASSAWGVGRLGYLQEFASGVPRLVYEAQSRLTSATNMQLRVGVKAITVSAGYAYAAGDHAVLTDAGDTSRWMRGRVISHVGTLLVVDVYWVVSGVSGSASSWVICKALGYLAENQATNKVTARKANPTDTTNIVKAGDAASILSVVDDSAALAAAGLSGICTSGKVYKLDNSAGTVNAYMQFFGATGNTNVHVVSAHVRAVGGSVDARVRSNNLAGAAVPPGNGYVRASISFTPSGTGDVLWVQASPGQVTYAILPGLEEGSYATSVIAGDTLAAVTRAADALSVNTAKIPPISGTCSIVAKTIAQDAASATIVRLDAGASDIVTNIRNAGSGPLQRVAFAGTGTAQGNVTLPVRPSKGQSMVEVMSVSPNNLIGATLQGPYTPDTIVDVYGGNFTRIFVGCAATNGAEAWGQPIAAIAVIPRAISQSECNARAVL